MDEKKVKETRPMDEKWAKAVEARRKYDREKHGDVGDEDEERGSRSIPGAGRRGRNLGESEAFRVRAAGTRRHNAQPLSPCRPDVKERKPAEARDGLPQSQGPESRPADERHPDAVLQVAR